MRTRWRPRGFFGLLFIIAIIGGGIVAAMPWAFHMGGRWRPLPMWFGSGTLVANRGTQFPIFITLYPAAHFSRLTMDGRRPAGGVQGNACLCTGPGASQYLKVSGTPYGAWQSTDGALVAFRLLEPTIVDVGRGQGGYFDIAGVWNGPDLVLTDRGSYSRPFRSGLRIEHATVGLRWTPIGPVNPPAKARLAGNSAKTASRRHLSSRLFSQ